MASDIIASTRPAGNKLERPLIVYPPRNAIFAIDPDIPDENSLIFFQAEGKGPFEWILNKEKIGSGPAPFSWKPRYGKYVLSLADSQGQIIDTVNFEVRGSPPDSSGAYTDAGANDAGE